MKKALITILSDGSNTDLDITKVLGTIAFVVFLILSFYAYGYKGSNWQPIEWATAAGILLASTGATSKIKDFTSKTNEDTTK